MPLRFPVRIVSTLMNLMKKDHVENGLHPDKTHLHKRLPPALMIVIVTLSMI